MWQVNYTKKAIKQVRKLSPKIQKLLNLLEKELKFSGPTRGNWSNFSKLGHKGYHCHIKKGRPTYVACWTVQDKKNKVMEVYYVGTHEKAPY